jgi:hypothetical protein
VPLLVLIGSPFELVTVVDQRASGPHSTTTPPAIKEVSILRDTAERKPLRVFLSAKSLQPQTTMMRLKS